MPDIDLRKYYTTEEAAIRLSLNSNKFVSEDYVRLLANKGIISKVEVHPRLNVYPRYEVDAYVVEERGAKAARAKKAKAGKEE